MRKQRVVFIVHRRDLAPHTAHLAEQRKQVRVPVRHTHVHTLAHTHTPCALTAGYTPLPALRAGRSSSPAAVSCRPASAALPAAAAAAAGAPPSQDDGDPLGPDTELLPACCLLQLRAGVNGVGNLDSGMNMYSYLQYVPANRCAWLKTSGVLGVRMRCTARNAASLRSMAGRMVPHCRRESSQKKRCRTL